MYGTGIELTQTLAVLPFLPGSIKVAHRGRMLYISSSRHCAGIKQVAIIRFGRLQYSWTCF